MMLTGRIRGRRSSSRGSIVRAGPDRNNEWRRRAPRLDCFSQQAQGESLFARLRLLVPRCDTVRCGTWLLSETLPEA